MLNTNILYFILKPIYYSVCLQPQESIHSSAQSKDVTSHVERR